MQTLGIRCLSWIPFLAASLILASNHAPPKSTLAHTSQDSILVDGLKIWRKPGAVQNGAACATCHSPDGIELAAYKFEDGDLYRRALPHLGPTDTQVLVDYIHALRLKYKLTQLRDPNLDRPLQPGGEILPGKTPEDRDLAFGLEIKEKFPTLFSGPIESLDQAKSAEAELLKVPANQLKIGFPLNRLSEDVAHGNEHSSIAQWLPEVPPQIAHSDLDVWYALEDAYLAQPTPLKLHELIVQHLKLVNISRMPGFAAISTLKFRALLVWQDRLRNQTEGSPLNVSQDVLQFGNYNPIWEVGEFARQMMDRDAAGIGMDAENQAKKLNGPSLVDQLHQLRLSWFWAGWLSDQGLFKTSFNGKTKYGMWLSESISKDGPYPIHNVYVNVRRQAVLSNDLSAWGETLPRRRRIWDFAGLRSFEFQTRDLPKGEAHRKLYITFTANCFRMNLLLLKNDIEKSGVVWVKVNTKANAKELLNFIRTYEPETKASAAKLETELDTLVDAAKERI